MDGGPDTKPYALLRPDRLSVADDGVDLFKPELDVELKHRDVALIEGPHRANSRLLRGEQARHFESGRDALSPIGLFDVRQAGPGRSRLMIDER